MRLPDSFLDDLRNRLSLSAVVGRKVVWDMKKTNQAKGDWWAPCPFHQEKTASFHVDDRKGFYYCFGCQAKGNLFGFVQETENVGFMEAVEILAAEAGMEMPAKDPRAAEKADLRTRLAEVTEAAAKWFRMQLAAGAGSDARRYLDGRGLSAKTQDRFEIGFAPTEADGLIKALEGKGIPWDLIEGAGLGVAEDDGRRRDRFINRIIFPIRDARSRCIGFGGRAMNPNSPAKYLNSPETALFDKGANLYNLGPARTAAGQGQPFLVAEGYMDVIALHQAGFEAAVAPLGTAVTERQLQLMWRVTPEPLIALDGDAAGQRAGLRVADLALPLIEAGQSLRFAVLPEGQDPDDLIRVEGRAAMQAVIDGAQPMLALLWAREIEGKSFDSPERRAALDRDLLAVISRIKDTRLRKHYAEDVKRRRAELFGLPLDAPMAPTAPGAPDRSARPWVPASEFRARRHAPPPASTSARSSALASGAAPDLVLEQVILAGLVLHPDLIETFADRLEALGWSGPHGSLAAALLRMPPGIDSDMVQDRLDPETLETLLAQSHVRISPVRRGAEQARLCVEDAVTRLAARRGADRERREAMEDFDDGADEALTWRLAEAARRHDAAQRARTTDDATGEDAAGMSDYLQGLLDTEVWKKTKKK
ncbi:DNA primase [Jannaschia sp. KMU-145]|uniref:DNA primase n=1 Tax=Jannaschia halovivens TaxID=3388667 RepID=UPI00396B28E1